MTIRIAKVFFRILLIPILSLKFTAQSPSNFRIVGYYCGTTDHAVQLLLKAGVPANQK